MMPAHSQIAQGNLSEHSKQIGDPLWVEQKQTVRGFEGFLERATLDDEWTLAPDTIKLPTHDKS